MATPIFDSGVTTGSIAPGTCLLPNVELQTLIGINLLCVTPIALSVVTCILRWNDGVNNRVETFTVLLTTLNNYVSTVIPVLQDANTALTVELVAVGTGQYRCLLTRTD